ncbi:FAD-dependent oxidoreductase [Vibrio olivae]
MSFLKHSKLGGQWALAAIPPTKEELSSFTVWQVHQLNALGVVIHLNTTLTPQLIEALQPDSVILATGALPFVPNIEGKDLEHVLNANDVLQGSAETGHNVVVIGGGLVGSETAAHLANHGRRVSIIEMNDDIFVGTPHATKHYLLKDLRAHDVAIHTNTQVQSITPDSVTVVDAKGNPRRLEGVDSVVMAIGSRPVSVIESELKKSVPEVITIGDALQVRKAMEAVEEGYLAGMAV